jgi:hypothetical protein
MQGLYAYATNVRTPAKPSLRFGGSGDFTSPSASAAGFTALVRTEKRRTYTASCAMVHWITYHACSPLSLCRCLLITTHLACRHCLQGSGSGTGENLNPVFSICVRLRVVVLTGGVARGWRVPGCLLAILAQGSQLQPRYSTERSTLQSVAVKRVRAAVSRLPFLGLQRDPPRKSLSLSAGLLFARSARLPATDSATAEMSIPIIS